MSYTLFVKSLTWKVKSQQVLDGVSFTGKSGDIIALVGENGAGKTTVMASIAGRRPSVHSEVTLEAGGETFDPALLPGAVGFLPDDGALISSTKVKDCLAELHILAQAMPVEDVESLAERYGVLRWRNKRVKSLSLGQRKRLSIIGLLIAQSPVVLLDEPFNGLDAQGFDLLKEDLQLLARAGCIVVFSTHVLDAVAEVATRMILLEGGQILFDGPLSRDNGSLTSSDIRSFIKSLP